MEDKFYVSVEAAMLLREKGYDKPTDYIYVIDGPFYSIWRNKDGNMESNYYPAPTKAEAIDWLESKGIVISVEYINGLWDCQIYSFVDATILHGKALPMVYDVVNFSTRLEAENAAIILALKEITKKITKL